MLSGEDPAASSASSFDFDFLTATASRVSLVQPPIVNQSRSDKFLAVLGDLDHKRQVYLFFGTASAPCVLALLTNAEQANYIRVRRPDLLPDYIDNPPSDHNIATIFEIHFYSDPVFIREYLLFLSRLSLEPRFSALLQSQK